MYVEAKNSDNKATNNMNYMEGWKHSPPCNKHESSARWTVYDHRGEHSG